MATFETPFWKKTKGQFGHLKAPYAAGTPSGKPYRSNTDLDWLYGKIAWASATAGASTLDTAGWKHLFKDGQGAWSFKDDGDGKEEAEWSDPVYIPKAHIISVNISGDPSSYGAVRTCKVVFKTYNKGQLNKYQDFFTPGKEMKVSIGWDGRLNSSDISESFKGKVYKFSLQLQPDGGYECTTEGIGEGNSIINNIKVDAAIKLNSPAITDSKGTVIPNLNIFSEFQKINAQALKSNVGAVIFLNKYPGAVVELPENYDESEESNSSDKQTMQKKAYITVESILMVTNELIKQYADPLVVGKFAFPDPPEYMQARAWNNIRSANPTEVLIDLNNYGDGPPLAPRLRQSLFGDDLEVKNIYISVDWLIENGSKINYIDKGSNKNESYLKLGQFWDKVFVLIQQNLGEAFSLSLAKNAGDRNDPDIYIIDINAMDTGLEVKYIDNQGSAEWVRNVNLTSNLPAEVSTAFYVTQQAPVEAKAGSGDQLTEFLLGTKAKIDPPSNTEYVNAVKAVGKRANAANVSALAAATKQWVNYSKSVTSIPAGILVPFELSVTLDGCGGWEYGDAIKSTYVPDLYNLGRNSIKIGFMITQVDHSVSDGDWTTTLSTKCKLYR